MRRLAKEYPGGARELSALVHDNPFQLLIATILSAQSTDEMVNKVTPAVFARYPTPADLAHADPDRARGADPLHRVLPLEDAQPHRHGARRSRSTSTGEVPRELEDLVTLPGVGRKTGNVDPVGRRSTCPGLPVDTHVGRLSRRLKLTAQTDPVKAEHDLNAIVPPEERGALSLRLILHGRRVCTARRPRCDECLLADICPSAFKVQ